MGYKANEHNRDDLLVDALARGLSQARAAAESGYSSRTVRRRLEDVYFCGRVAQARREMVRRTAGSLAAAGAGAVTTLLRLMTDGRNERIRLDAAKAVLGSLPTQAILGEYAEAQEPRRIEVAYESLRDSILRSEAAALRASATAETGGEACDLLGEAC